MGVSFKERFTFNEIQAKTSTIRKAKLCGWKLSGLHPFDKNAIPLN